MDMILTWWVKGQKWRPSGLCIEHTIRSKHNSVNPLLPCKNRTKPRVENTQQQFLHPEQKRNNLKGVFPHHINDRNILVSKRRIHMKTMAIARGLFQVCFQKRDTRQTCSCLYNPPTCASADLTWIRKKTKKLVQESSKLKSLALEPQNWCLERLSLFWLSHIDNCLVWILWKTTLRSRYLIRWLAVLDSFRSFSCRRKRTAQKTLTRSLINPGSNGKVKFSSGIPL